MDFWSNPGTFAGQIISCRSFPEWNGVCMVSFTTAAEMFKPGLSAIDLNECCLLVVGHQWEYAHGWSLQTALLKAECNVYVECSVLLGKIYLPYLIGCIKNKGHGWSRTVEYVG